MIDWLELLWKDAEEGQAFDLPGEPDLLPARTGDLNREEEDGGISSVQSLAGDPEPQSSPWQAQEQFEIAEAPGGLKRWEAAGADAERSSLRSVLGVVKRPVGGSAVQQIRRSAAGSAMAALYHRVRETVSPVQPGIPGRSGTVVVREEVPATPGLTEEGLDRSLQRDSRRYDGGMSIY